MGRAGGGGGGGDGNETGSIYQLWGTILPRDSSLCLRVCSFRDIQVCHVDSV